MGRLSKVADFLQKSVTLTCMVGTVYLLVMTGRNYLSLREKRLANAALIEAKAEDEPASSKQGPGEEKTISQVHGFRKLKLLVKLQAKLQNPGPLLTMHQTSRLIWLGSGKN